MLGRRLTISYISAYLLRLDFNYARIFGVVNFTVSSSNGGGLLAHNCPLYMWFCVLSRVFWIANYCYFYLSVTSDDWIMHILNRISGGNCLICTGCVLVLQIWYGQRVLRLVNRFLRLFRRVRALSELSPAGQHHGFGGRRELVLLIMKACSLIYEVGSDVPLMFCHGLTYDTVSVISNVYITIGAGMIMHICFVGYLCVGALYAEINRYVRYELRRQLRTLNRRGVGRPSRGQLRIVAERLDECVAIYDEIQRVGSTFHKFFELPICLTMLLNFSAIVLVIYYIIMETKLEDYGMWFMVAQLFADVVLLTLAAHGAVSSSRVVRHLGIETCYINGHNGWHMKLDMFLSRLNINEFRVRPLGLFEVSNELILVFISGLVTYLTYVVQSAIQSKQLSL